MGFLRKVGKKIKKGIKKLFGSKLGRVVGMVGLYFAMGAIAKGLTNWASSTFGQAASTTAEAAATTTAETVTTTAGEAVTTTAGDAVAAAASNTEAANTAMAAIDSEAMTGSLNASTSITDAITTNQTALNQSVGTINTNMTEFAKSKIDFTTQLQQPEMFKSPTRMDLFSEGVGQIGQSIKDLPSTAADFVADIPTKIAEAPGKAYEYVTGSEFLPDVAQGAATSYVTSTIMGEPEEPFMSGGIMPQPTMEAAQGAYIQDLAPQYMAMTGSSRMPSFQELSQQTMYGTGSPQYLMQMYQPLGVT